MIHDSALLDAIPFAVYATDADGRITYFNEAAVEMWANRPKLGVDLWCGSWRLYWPDGRPLPHDQCPMAVTLKEGRPVRGVEAIAERPDGTRFLFMPYPTPLRDGSGRLVGAVNVLIDISDQRRTEADSTRLAAIVSSSDDAIVSKTFDGVITSWNTGATRIFGYEASEMIGQSIMKIIPPELEGEEKQIVAKLRRGERIDHYETIRIAKDGRRVDISLTVSPLRNKAGHLVGASKVARDISERKHAEWVQRLLIDELNHRVKNTLATVQAIASQSLQRARDSDEFASSFSGRLQALARAHGILSHGPLQGAEVMDLVRDQVLLGSSEDRRIACSGPHVVLPAQAAMHIALVLHELGTNARKYGALSVPDGRLRVVWEVRTSGGPLLLLRWMERGGPKVTAPAKSGFGTTLIEQTVKGPGGKAIISYGADGVTCEIRFPLIQEHSAKTAAIAKVSPPAMGLSMIPASIPPSVLRGKRVLVIEDEPLLSMDMEATLRDAGCDVIGPAATLGQAKSLTAEGTYDVALVDANLSGQPVDDIAAALTQRNVPFAFVSGYGREGLPTGFREAILLNKPFSPTQLLGIVSTLLQQSPDVVPLRSKRR